MTKPLILATRPAAHNDAWRQQLEARGFQVAMTPLLEIRPIDADASPALRNILADLDQYQKLIFVSRNAVAHMLRLIDLWWPQLPQDQQYFAVGAKTADDLQAQLQRLGHYADIHSCTGMNSEGLLELDALKAVAAQKIVICRGVGGRPLLAEVLEQRGATVAYAELYQRACPQALGEQLSQITLNAATIVPVFSGEALQNLASVSASREVKLIVPSQRVAKQAAELGFRQINIADNASEASMMAAIQETL